MYQGRPAPYRARRASILAAWCANSVRPDSGAKGNIPLGPSNPSRVPWPPASRTAATAPSRSRSSPASRASASRSRSAAVRASGIRLAGSGGAISPATAGAASPSRPSTRRPIRFRSSAVDLVGQFVAAILGQGRERRGQVLLARGAEAVLEGHAPGRSATFVTPSTRSAIRR